MKVIQTLKRHPAAVCLVFVVVGCTTAALCVYFLLWKPMEEKSKEAAQAQAQAEAQAQAKAAQAQAAQAQAQAAQAQAQAAQAQAQAAQAEAQAQANRTESTLTNCCPEALEALEAINTSLGEILGLPPV
jgi:F0F1-type ATP synthase membrane subunit b/b'